MQKNDTNVKYLMNFYLELVRFNSVANTELKSTVMSEFKTAFGYIVVWLSK